MFVNNLVSHAGQYNPNFIGLKNEQRVDTSAIFMVIRLTSHREEDVTHSSIPSPHSNNVRDF